MNIKGDLFSRSLTTKILDADWKINYPIWQNTTSFNVDDTIVYNDKLYISKTTNLAKQPDLNPSDWVILGGRVTSFSIVQNLVAGNNVITHNLGSIPKFVQVYSTDFQQVIVNVVAKTSTTLTINVLSLVANADINISL